MGLQVRDQCGLQSEFQNSQGYTEKICLESHPPQKKKTAVGKQYVMIACSLAYIS